MNRQNNATFLDGTSGSASVNASVAVDEEVYGSPGRAALVATATGSGNTILSLDNVSMVSGQMAEVFVHVGVVGNAIPNVALGTTFLQHVKSAKGPPSRGIPSTMHFYYLKRLWPTTGSERLTANCTLSTGNKLIMVKPFVDPNAPANKQCWQPGPHTNPDLNLNSWPTDLPDFLEGIDAQGTPTLRGFTGDDNVESTTKISRLRRIMFRGELTLTLQERDILEQFYLNNQGQFWFNRPDTQQVYIARWSADGEPNDTGLIRGQRRTSIGLNLSLS